MLDKIVKIDDSKYVLVYNTHTVCITDDRGNALAIVEYLLSPKFNMSYSQYIHTIRMEGEDTCPGISA